MNKVVVIAETIDEAIETCRDTHGWTPDAVREVDSGDENTKAYMCFENATDAEIWDNQT